MSALLGGGFWAASAAFLILTSLQVERPVLGLIIVGVTTAVGFWLSELYVEKWEKRTFRNQGELSRQIFRPYTAGIIARGMIVGPMVLIFFVSGSAAMSNVLEFVVLGTAASGAFWYFNRHHRATVIQAGSRLVTVFVPPLVLLEQVTVDATELKYQCWPFTICVPLTAIETSDIHEWVGALVGPIPVPARTGLRVLTLKFSAAMITWRWLGGGSRRYEDTVMTLHGIDWPIDEISRKLNGEALAVTATGTGPWKILTNQNIGMFFLVAPVLVIGWILFLGTLYAIISMLAA